MDQMFAAVDAIMRGEAESQHIGLLLTALANKGETFKELAGAAAAMRQHMTPIHSSRDGVVDTCGTGGDRSGTFNISTAAALVAAAAGVPVAKHGNRSITSRSGSADVLSALGVNVEAPVSIVEACLEEVGICFCFAPLLHPSMRQVNEVRRSLGMPTIFNLIGPLCNPASAPFQLVGVGRREVAERMAPALAMLHTQRAIVVTGSDGLDEVTISGPTHVIDVRETAVEPIVVNGQELTDHEHTVLEETWTPNDFGLESQVMASLVVDGPEQSAAMIVRVLAAERGPPRDIVVANASAALWVAGQASTLSEGARLAAEAIDSGAARETLRRFVEVSHAKDSPRRH
ncbi:MAG: anthranilate phosphoribosyltransferase [Planctomycetia bacterium]|nr:anthranilate phosphoribosyltransferase [Planctomycetia bacterium]